jgi:hypothetical protein
MYFQRSGSGLFQGNNHFSLFEGKRELVYLMWGSLPTLSVVKLDIFDNGL